MATIRTGTEPGHRSHLARRVTARGVVAAAAALFLALPLAVTPAHADAICSDGWISSSSGSGTCSHHGGVGTWVTPAPYSPPPSWSPAPYPDPGPSALRMIYLKRLKPGQKDSDSVRHLQKRLNKILLPGSAKLPVTGNYGKQTKAAVRRWQLNVDGASGRGADGILGARQARKLFPLASNYILVKI